MFCYGNKGKVVSKINFPSILKVFMTSEEMMLASIKHIIWESVSEFLCYTGDFLLPSTAIILKMLELGPGRKVLLHAFYSIAIISADWIGLGWLHYSTMAAHCDWIRMAYCCEYIQLHIQSLIECKSIIVGTYINHIVCMCSL